MKTEWKMIGKEHSGKHYKESWIVPFLKYYCENRWNVITEHLLIANGGG